MNWPFTDLSGAKPRPALVISNDTLNAAEQDVILLAISSNISRSSAYDLTLWENDPAFRGSGLKAASVFRCAKIFTAEGRRLVRRHLGKMGGDWLGKILTTVNSLF